MPITESASIRHSITSITFREDGSVSVSVSRILNESVNMGDDTFIIAAQDISSVLDIPQPDIPATVREYIVTSIYDYLVNGGNIKGVISY
jgi:hypothetical protein